MVRAGPGRSRMAVAASGDAKIAAALTPDAGAPVPVEKGRPAGSSGVDRRLPADPLVEHVLGDAMSRAGGWHRTPRRGAPCAPP